MEKNTTTRSFEAAVILLSVMVSYLGSSIHGYLLFGASSVPYITRTDKSLLYYGLLCYVLYRTLRRGLVSLNGLLKSIVVGGIMSSVIGVALYFLFYMGINMGQIYTSLNWVTSRNSGTATEPIVYASYLLPCIWMVFAEYVGIIKIFRSRARHVAYAIILLSFILTFALSAFLSVLITLVISVWVLSKYHNFKSAVRVFFAGGFVAATGILGIYSFVPQVLIAYAQKIYSIFHPNVFNWSVLQRSSEITVAIRSMHIYPLLGVGPGDFGLVYGTLATHGDFPFAGTHLSIANLYVELLAENGILGAAVIFFALAYLLLIGIRNIQYTKQHDKQVSLIVLFSLVSILVDYVFMNQLDMPIIWIIMAMSLFLSVNYRQDEMNLSYGNVVNPIPER